MFKIFQLFKIQPKSGLIILILSVTSLWAGWQSEVIYTGSKQIFNFAIGDARNDGKPRIYAVIANLGLIELGYLGDGRWSTDTIDLLRSSSQSAMDSYQIDNENWNSKLTIGPGRNDGVNRIYSFPYGSDSLYEYTYSNGNWIRMAEKVLSSASNNSVSLLIASARNGDPTMRVYCCSATYRNLFPDTLYELTWQTGGWNIHRVPTRAPAGCLIVGQGRNDDTVRLYIDGSPFYFVELTYRGEWCEDTIFSEYYPNDYALSFRLIEQGYNDKLNRFYGVKVKIGMEYRWYLSEVTYWNGKWEMDTIVGSESDFYSLSIGAVRNDDTIRLYAFSDRIQEYTYRDLWMSESIGSDPDYGNLYIGKGRGDDTNRLYSYRYSIREFSYTPTAIEEDRGISQKPIEQLLITPNPSFDKTKIWYAVSEESPVSLKIYDAMGELVKELARGYKKQGKYTAYWDGRDDKGNEAGNGVFFCQLTTGTHTFSKKIIRLK